MGKFFGYFIMFIGLVVLFTGVILKTSLIKNVPVLSNIPFANKINIKIIPIIGIILIVVGFFLIKPSSSKTPKHLPIYDKTGKKIVGYRESK